jgi:hypothetical protein
MTSAEVRAEGAGGVYLFVPPARTPAVHGRWEARIAQGRRQSEPDRREPSPQAPNPLTG